MKLTLLLLCAALLVACSKPAVKVEHVTGTVVEVYYEPSVMGCIGTDWRTIVHLEDARVASVCGKIGKPGDKVRGCWESGHTNSFSDSALSNGFRLVCREEP